ncbi:glycosyltransferase [Tunturiibacter gelidiferens]|uniref:glycosyltransferase n=1 Tax=Tunturiibacter gelidiferens TaxID=3069689 RepID=UPI003D9BE0EF
MGCFQHPLLAGTFGAISVPLFAALWVQAPKRRFMATIGFLSATVIVIASASSTPLLAYACGILALAMWPMRMHMRILRWALVGTLVLLQILMKVPVWALIQRVDLIGGSSGFHRYYLVDQFIRNAGEWWLLGARSTAQWGPDMWDHANQYVAIGVTSGVVPLAVFLAVIVWGFKSMGRLTHWRKETGKALLAWFLGSALFVNVVAFFGISYFDQIALVWWCLLAMISTLSVSAPAHARVSPGPPSAVPVIMPRGSSKYAIPIFNRAHRIRAVVESLLSQTMAIEEVILVDHGSEDGAPDRIPHDRAHLGPALAEASGAVGYITASVLGAVHCIVRLAAWRAVRMWGQDRIAMLVK